MGKRSSRDEHRGRILERRLRVFLIIGFACLAARLLWLQVIRAESYQEKAKQNRVHKKRIIAPRGLVLDRRGRVLVDNVPRFEITIDWTDGVEMKNNVRTFFEYFSMDSADVLSRFESWKKRNAGAPFPIVKDADKIIISQVMENNDLFPWVKTNIKPRRRYRFGSMAAHLLGYVSEISKDEISEANELDYQPGDMIGKTGLEAVCERYLRGRDGSKAVERNAAGQELRDLYYRAPLQGRDVTLTLDAELQAYLEELLRRRGVGAAVAMNVEDGSIVAAASVPQFDPNMFSTGIVEKEWKALNESSLKPLFNRVCSASYPPGSVIKVISAIAGLENEVVDRSDYLVYCTGSYRFGNRSYRCWKAGGHGYMNLYTALVQSCDSYFFKLGEDLDVDELARAARDFGLGERTGFDLGNESAGLVPDRRYYNGRYGRGKWTQGYILNNVIGQGEYLVTPLQVCRMMAALANGGYLVTPHVIDSIEHASPRAYGRSEVKGLEPEILHFVQRALRAVVESEHGTAHWSMTREVSFAGKTGTAQNPHGEDHAWFAGYAPVDDPEIAIAVVVENAGHGGSVAAPLARDFFLRCFAPDSSLALKGVSSSLETEEKKP